MCSPSRGRRERCPGTASRSSRAQARRPAENPEATRRGRTLLGLRRGGSAERASTAPPSGRTAAPEKAITPFWPIRMSGVARPWMTSRPIIVEKAVPTSTVLPSPRLAPTIVSAKEAAAGGACARGDEGEVHPALDRHLLVAEEVQDRGGQRGAGGHQDQNRRYATSQQVLHRGLYRPIRQPDEGRVAEHLATSDYHRLLNRAHPARKGLIRGAHPGRKAS